MSWNDEQGNLCVRPPINGLPYHFFVTASGDGLGNYNLNGNYSAADTDFYFIAPARFDIYTVLVTIADDEQFWLTDYGTIFNTGPVVNGVKFYMRPYGSSVDYQLLMRSNLGITKNYEWFHLTPDVKLSSFETAGGQILSVAVHMAQEYGQPLAMNPGDRFIVRLKDDFSGLLSHTFRLHGILQTNTPI